MPDYDADFYGWANEQAALMRAGRLAGVSSRIFAASLGATLADVLQEAYALALIAARRDTGLDRGAIPPGNPWSPAQTTDDGFYPA